ncbi:MAG TPA: hypothetical protein VK137_10445, partial [Planctomycetaceae bacterium]|nr:hypothetical protein [Planctomycetaceae bacterium]
PSTGRYSTSGKMRSSRGCCRSSTKSNRPSKSKQLATTGTARPNELAPQLELWRRQNPVP